MIAMVFRVNLLIHRHMKSERSVDKKPKREGLNIQDYLIVYNQVLKLNIFAMIYLEYYMMIKKDMEDGQNIC